MDRRRFLRQTAQAGAIVGIWGLLGCEDSNKVTILTQGKTPDFITPNDAFYLQFGNGTLPENYPQLTKDSWRLAVSGLVDHPQTFTFDDLERLATDHQITFLKTMRCILDSPFEPLISNAYWTGVPLAALLHDVGIHTAARRLRITGSDGFTNNLVISEIMADPQPGELPAILCYQMNGQDLPLEHGFPVRLIIPRKFGYKNMKWVSALEVTQSEEPFGRYEADFGFFDNGDLQPISYITQPFVPRPASDVGTIPLGTSTLVGTALTGPSPTTMVEVKIQEGQDGVFADAPWEPVEIVPRNEIEFFIEQFSGTDPTDFIAQFQDSQNHQYPFKNVWVIWRHDINVSGSGTLKISVRATDGTGFTQPEPGSEAEDTDLLDGDTNTISIIVRKGS